MPKSDSFAVIISTCLAKVKQKCEGREKNPANSKAIPRIFDLIFAANKFYFVKFLVKIYFFKIERHCNH